MRIIFLVIFSILFYSCEVLDPGFTKNFSIQTDDGKYVISNKLTVNVKFSNNLGKEVIINRIGCGFPNFILEKLEDNKWLEAGGPICVALAVPPVILENEDIYNTQVSMYVGDEIQSGIYRMKFFIKISEDSRVIEPHKIYCLTLSKLLDNSNYCLTSKST